ncbi:hypothetical protein D1629_23440 (plasmid) [Pantoea agglomerans]|nr:hypothetical protein D1629_23440 [Pantoea agglomerans]QAV52223.1 hypothetical protein D1628_23360 [Pantoea agglomerans]
MAGTTRRRRKKTGIVSDAGEIAYTATVRRIGILHYSGHYIRIRCIPRHLTIKAGGGERIKPHTQPDHIPSTCRSRYNALFSLDLPLTNRGI